MKQYRTKIVSIYFQSVAYFSLNISYLTAAYVRHSTLYVGVWTFKWLTFTIHFFIFIIALSSSTSSVIIFKICALFDHHTWEVSSWLIWEVTIGLTWHLYLQRWIYQSITPRYFQGGKYLHVSIETIQLYDSLPYLRVVLIIEN